MSATHVLHACRDIMPAAVLVAAPPSLAVTLELGRAFTCGGRSSMLTHRTGHVAFRCERLCNLVARMPAQHERIIQRILFGLVGALYVSMVRCIAQV